MQKSRVFIAIPVSEEIRKIIRTELDKLQLDIKLIPEKNYHLTVLFLGDILDNKLDSLMKSLSITAQSIPPFLLKTDSIIAKSNPHYHMLWVSFQASMAFEQMASKVALSLGYPLTKKPIPHINLTRSKKKFKSDFPKALNSVELGVDKIELWKSILHPEGATYSLLGSFKLNEINQ